MFRSRYALNTRCFCYECFMVNKDNKGGMVCCLGNHAGTPIIHLIFFKINPSNPRKNRAKYFFLNWMWVYYWHLQVYFTTFLSKMLREGFKKKKKWINPLRSWPTHPTPLNGFSKKKHVGFLGFLAHLEQKNFFKIFHLENFSTLIFMDRFSWLLAFGLIFLLWTLFTP